MFDFWTTKKTVKCVHPKWEIIKEVDMPSVAKQMQLDALSPEDKAKILLKLQPSDFDKSYLLVMSCPFCGEIKEFKAEHKNTEERVCSHQWEIIDIQNPSSFEKTCGEDATFEQRRQIAAKMEPNDFTSSVHRRMVCKVCGEYVDDYFSEERDGSGSRCSHRWQAVFGDPISELKNRYEKKAGDYKELRVRQTALLTCDICGATMSKVLDSIIELYPNGSKR